MSVLYNLILYRDSINDVKYCPSNLPFLISNKPIRFIFVTNFLSISNFNLRFANIIFDGAGAGAVVCVGIALADGIAGTGAVDVAVVSFVAGCAVAGLPHTFCADDCGGAGVGAGAGTCAGTGAGAGIASVVDGVGAGVGAGTCAADGVDADGTCAGGTCAGGTCACASAGEFPNIVNLTGL